jgi:ABC-2 type transport system ATP-binding protein
MLPPHAPLATPSGQAATGPFVIETTGLAKSYGKVQPVQSLDLRLPHNTICGFLGPNGAGKTTAMKLLVGLAHPTGGNGTVLGYDIRTATLAIRRHVGYLPQDPRFYDDQTARETLQFVARFFFPRLSAATERRITELLEVVGLHDKADRMIGGFSGGERQRLGIAQAMIHDPILLLLDEPAAALDPIGRRDVLEVMQRLRAHTTIFFSTHLLDDVQRVSDRVVIMQSGRVLQQGPLRDLLADPTAIIYEVAVRGEVASLAALLTQQAWVTAVTTRPSAEGATVCITVKDEQAAHTYLLPLLAQSAGGEVVRFGRQQQNLEQIFLTMMGATTHDHV